MPMLEGKVALVTGASSGIGRATARVMAAHGAAVVLAARRVPELESLADEINAGGGRAVFIGTDVTQEHDVKEMVELAVSEFGRLDCAANVAGGGFRSELDWPEADPESFLKTIELNATATWYCMKHQLAQMLKQGGGSIVNTSSIAGLRTSLSEGYTSAKYAINGITAAAAAKYGGRGVRVNAVAPGIIEVGVWPVQFENNPGLRDRWSEAIPAGRPGTGEEVGEVIAWLASDASSYVTGVILPVDGGNAVTIAHP